MRFLVKHYSCYFLLSLYDHLKLRFIRLFQSDRKKLDWVRLDRIRLNWIRFDSIGLDSYDHLKLRFIRLFQSDREKLDWVRLLGWIGCDPNEIPSLFAVGTYLFRSNDHSTMNTFYFDSIPNPWCNKNHSTSVAAYFVLFCVYVIVSLFS